MKKQLLLLTCMTGLLYPVPYSQLRSGLKEQLSQGHAKFKVISHQDYMTFIEKYVVKAEQDLAIIREISKITDITDYQASLFSMHFNDLKTIHGYIFDDLIKPDQAVKHAIQSYSTWLLKSIHHLKQECNLDIDPEVELKNTLELLHKANQDFIKHIGRTKCVQLRMAKRWERFKEKTLGIILFPIFPWMRWL